MKHTIIMNELDIYSMGVVLRLAAMNLATANYQTRERTRLAVHLERIRNIKGADTNGTYTFDWSHTRPPTTATEKPVDWLSEDNLRNLKRRDYAK